jgi:hypothetical protein
MKEHAQRTHVYWHCYTLATAEVFTAVGEIDFDPDPKLVEPEKFGLGASVDRVFVRGWTRQGSIGVTVRLAEEERPLDPAAEKVAEATFTAQGPLYVCNAFFETPETAIGEGGPVTDRPGRWHVRLEARGRQAAKRARKESVYEPVEHHTITLWPAAASSNVDHSDDEFDEYDDLPFVLSHTYSILTDGSDGPGEDDDFYADPVALVPFTDGATVTTWTESGPIDISIEHTTQPPSAASHDTVVESTVVTSGPAVVWQLQSGPVPDLVVVPAAGRWRVRISASGRDAASAVAHTDAPLEHHLIQVWPE